MKWLRRLFGKKKTDILKENVISDLKNIQNKVEGYNMNKLGDDIYFVYLDHGRARWLYNERESLLIPLVSHRGCVMFLEESDIEDKAIELIKNECPRYLMSANFRFWVFPFKDGLADVEWTVRPDGMYWADEDGYGMTDEDAISLHGKITPDGKPAGKFCLYEGR